KRHGLIDGEHYVTASPNTKHQRVVGNLYWMIRSHLEAHPIGEVFMAPYDVVFSNFDIVEPDLIYLSRERDARVITRLHAKGVPELVVATGSPVTRKLCSPLARSAPREGSPGYTPRAFPSSSSTSAPQPRASATRRSSGAST